jgi:hypothetical protein
MEGTETTLENVISLMGSHKYKTLDLNSDENGLQSVTIVRMQVSAMHLLLLTPMIVTLLGLMVRT